MPRNTTTVSEVGVLGCPTRDNDVDALPADLVDERSADPVVPDTAGEGDPEAKPGRCDGSDGR